MGVLKIHYLPYFDHVYLALGMKGFESITKYKLESKTKTWLVLAILWYLMYMYVVCRSQNGLIIHPQKLYNI